MEKERQEVNKAIKEQAKRNKGWEDNHAAITEAFLKLVGLKKRRPTLEEVRDEIKRKADPGEIKTVKTLGIDTICKHLQELEFEPTAHPLRIFTDQVILAIARSAIKGSSASQKLFMQVMEGWREGQELTGAGGVPLVPTNIDLSKLSIAELKVWQQLAAKATAENASNPTGN